MNLIPRLAAISAASLAFAVPCLSAADTQKAKSPSDAEMRAAGLTSAQLLSGLKSGLTTMVERAGAELTKPGGLQVEAPTAMGKLEAGLKKMNQSGAFDSFKASLNQAATSVAPQTTAALKAAIGSLTIDDASALFSGAPDSATRMMRKTAESALRTKLMPLISQAIATNGTAAKAKDLIAKAGPMASMMGAPNTSDLENHVLTQLLETTFGYLGKQEAALRANPSQLKDSAAVKVFSLGKK
jgi:hypothetical protein